MIIFIIIKTIATIIPFIVITLIKYIFVRQTQRRAKIKGDSDSSEKKRYAYIQWLAKYYCFILGIKVKAQKFSPKQNNSLTIISQHWPLIIWWIAHNNIKNEPPLALIINKQEINNLPFVSKHLIKLFIPLQEKLFFSTEWNTKIKQSFTIELWKYITLVRTFIFIVRHNIKNSKNQKQIIEILRTIKQSNIKPKIVLSGAPQAYVRSLFNPLKVYYTIHIRENENINAIW